MQLIADAPRFGETLADVITCNDELTCAVRVGETGTLYCDSMSNPVATLSVSIDVQDNTTISVTEDDRIVISPTSTNVAGTYTCTATNIIEGMSRAETRTFRLFVGGELPSTVVMTSSGRGKALW